ncbi:MAG: ABC transporter permease [Ignavibacteriales bacterium]|nr:ABC transporter permease [Ignavibacteriales bacterium]
MSGLNIAPVVRKEFRQIRRDKRILGVLLFVPALMLVMFGYALNFDVKHTRMGVCDLDRTNVSREFAQQFFTTEFFDRIVTIEREQDIDRLVDGEEIRVALVIPRHFGRDVERGVPAQVQIIVDGSNSNSATVSVGYANNIVQQYSAKVLTNTLMRTSRRTVAMPLDFRPRVWYNPELRSSKFLVPGLVAFILMVVAVVSTSLSIVREKELNTMEQLMVSPVRPIELILGKTIPYGILSIAATVSIIVLGYLLFDVSVKGSVVLLAIVCAVFLIGSLGLGLLVSTIADSQQTAFSIAVMISMLPTFILSGFVFPIRNMPSIIQAITYIIPARYFLVALRAVMLKGVGLSAFWDQFLLLSLYALVIIIASTARLRKMLK